MKFDYKENCGSQAIVLGMNEGGEKICSASGRISTQPGTSTEIYENSSDAVKNASLIKKVTRSGHNSVVEHNWFNIAFCNVTVVVEQFMIEFRLASFTVKSRRYVDFSNSGYYVPEFNSEDSGRIFKEHIDGIFAEYQKLLDAGIPKEDARFILPYCFRSNFYCSMNARELLNVLKAMLFGRGKKFPEIYNLGKQILNQVSVLSPGIFDDFLDKEHNYRDEADFSKFCIVTESDKSDQLIDVISYTGDADSVVAKAALLNSTSLSVKDAEKSAKDNCAEIIKELLRSSRPRALESVQFTARYNGISLASLTHLVRHRIQSVIIPPLTSVDKSKYIIPESVKEKENIFNDYVSVFKKNEEIYNVLKSNGESEESLVYLNLSGNTLNVVSTMNARELLTFFKLRTCTRAQWEIQDYANELLFKLRNISPMVFNNYGPSCYMNGQCPEGRFSCGRAKEMQEKYRA